MTKMSDLPGDLVGEILSRVPMTFLSAVRSTCKKWDALSKNRIFGKAAARKQFLGFMMMDYKVCSLRFDLHGIRDEGYFVDTSIKQIGKFNHVEMSQIFHCDGLLLLCIIEEDLSRIMVWNPYLGQIRWIKPRNNFHGSDIYALGYGSNNNHNHKILRIFDPNNSRSCGFEFEIYDFSSDSWRVLDVTPDWDILCYRRGVSLKGNTYFIGSKRIILKDADVTKVEDFLLCFDFATESFVPRLSLPIHSYAVDTVALSCVREEQLALLYQSWEELSNIMEIWVTTKIEPNVVLWSKFLEVDMKPLIGYSLDDIGGSFFIDEEKKVAVVFDSDEDKPIRTCRYHTAYIIGQDDYFKSVKIRENPKLGTIVCYSYVPSLVQLQINQKQHKRKERDD